MMTVRWAGERGRTELTWLTSFHTFSFADYYDPNFNGFGALRVINEDKIAPGAGFPEHFHRDMEIITYVLSGVLEHRDSLGNGSLLRPGQLQKMTAGKGIHHSEYNASDSEELHLLQIWITPKTKGLSPGYEEISLSNVKTNGQFTLVGTTQKKEDTLTIHQDLRLYLGLLSPGQTASYTMEPDRKVWLHLADGAVRMHGHALFNGDGVAIDNESKFELAADAASHILLFDISS